MACLKDLIRAQLGVAPLKHERIVRKLLQRTVARGFTPAEAEVARTKIASLRKTQT